MNHTSTSDYEEFQKELTKAVQDRIPADTQVEITEVIKNNGVILKGMTFHKDIRGISPTIYLERYHERYKRGMEIETIADEILDIWRKGTKENVFDIREFLDFEKARKRIVYKLVNYEKNKGLLSQIPHKPYLDMAVVYYYLLENDELQNATILIYNNHLESWGITQKELEQVAKENTPHLLKEDLRSITEVLMQILTKREAEMEDICEESKDTGMYVLSNQSKIFGAAAILYSGVLKQFSEKINKDIFILPSSVHEVILIPKEEGLEWEKLEELVKEVNSTQVEDVEILSDSVYCYQRSRDAVFPAWAVA